MELEDEPVSPLPFQAKNSPITQIVRGFTGNMKDIRLLDQTIRKTLDERRQQEEQEIPNPDTHLEALRRNNITSPTVKSMTYRMIMNLTSSLFQSLLSLFACLVYVVSTYYSETESKGIFDTLEMTIASLFALDYGVGFYQSKDKKKFMMTFLNIVDLLTIFPVIVSLLSDQTTGSLAFARIFRILRVIRILRLYRMFKQSGSTTNGRPLLESSEVNRQIIITVSSLLAIVFISTGIVHTLSQTDYFKVNIPTGESSLSFDLALYYIIITTFTIGYGDIYPLNNFSRAVVGLFIICVIVVMSQQTARLSELVKKSSQYRKPYRGERHSHVVLTGSLTAVAIVRFLREFYHPDHGTKPTKCCVLLVGDETPGREILEIMNHPSYDDAVLYLEADFLKEDTLLKAKVASSSGVFILTDQHSHDSTKNDTYALLAAAATKEHSSAIPVYVQLVKPEMLVHQGWIKWDMAFSTWKIKIGLLAANAFIPGFSTFVCNLITSRTGTVDPNMQDKHWMLEYIEGLDNELYLVPVPQRLVGVNFHNLVEEMYLLKRVIVLGVQSKQQEDVFDILLNPINYGLKENDKVFVIAKDSAQAQIPVELSPVEDVEVEPEIAKELEKLKSRVQKRKSHIALDQRYYAMWEADLRGLIWDHILIFGKIEYLSMIMETFSYLTNQTICYVSNLPPDKAWQQVSRRYSNVVYLQCSLSEPEELSHTAINFSSHVLIFSSKVNEMSVEDSGVLPLVRLIEHTFSCHYTVELVNEVNMKYLEQKPLLELSVLKHILWPRYAASDVFLSSTLDFVLAQAYYNNFVIDFIQRLILYENSIVETGVDENCRVQSIQMPTFSENVKVTFHQAFLYFLRRARPILILAVYRGTGPMGNDTPYILTSPARDTVLFPGDSLIALGVAEEPAHPVPRLKRHDTVRFKGRTRAKAATTILVRKETIADSAVRVVENEKEDRLGQTDEGLLDALKEHLERTKKEREVLLKQNEMLLNLASEYTTVKQLLLGNTDDNNLEESDDERTPPVSPY